MCICVLHRQLSLSTLMQKDIFKKKVVNAETCDFKMFEEREMKWSNSTSMKIFVLK